MQNNIENLLSEHGIRPTANRIMIASALAEAKKPMSMTELEQMLETIDKSGIFRTLTIFHKHHLVHSVESGDGVMYEICRSRGEDHDEDLHAHFHCEVCGKTFCMENIPVPEVTLPQGYEMSSVNYVIKGICPDCSSKR